MALFGKPVNHLSDAEAAELLAYDELRHLEEAEVHRRASKQGPQRSFPRGVMRARRR